LLFYIDGSEVDLLRIGDRISGAGSLVVDYYIWAEFLKEYKDPPNLFYKLKVERLRGLYIRSQPPSMSWKNTAFSDRLRGERYSDADIREVSAMYLRESECPFYLVDLDDQDITEAIVPKTFLRASASQHELGADAKDARLKL
jgi:hypothetical protein